ncbi:MAG: hypothetical protein IKG93_01885 [Clostridiales bacterium]|nr:hypothetical protein [Clostridiales bacterium]
MSLAKSKNEFSKKDMNFFSEFSSAASQNFSSAFPFFLLAALSIIIITLVVWIACSVSTMKKNNRINDLRADMAKPEYLAQLAAKDKSQAEVEKLREYYFVLTSLDSRVSSVTTSNSATFAAAIECLPNDTILTKFDEADGVIEISGQSLNGVSPVNYLHLLQEKKDLFGFITDKIEPIDPTVEGYDKNTLMYGTMQYKFTFKCSSRGHYIISWASYLDGKTPTPLSPLTSNSEVPGKEKIIPNVATFVDSGVTYTLTNIKVNSVAVSAAQLQDAINTNEFKIKMSQNMNVELIYSAPKAEEGGAS